jgi:hypothetical protein|nr:MAG TPA: hypothetical protein [Caudoviricetes sp.]
MEGMEYQDLLRLLFLKMANESGRKIKIPKNITHSSFNVFFKSVRIREIEIENTLLSKSIIIHSEMSVEKPLSQLIKHYGYWDKKSKPFFLIEDNHKDFISIRFNPNPEAHDINVFFYNERFKQIYKALVYVDVRYSLEDIFDEYMGRNKIRGEYILKVKKERIGDIFVRAGDTWRTNIPIESILSENLLERIAPNGY